MLSNPFRLVTDTQQELGAWRWYLHDLNRRQSPGAHKAVMGVGLLSFLLVVAHCITLEVPDEAHIPVPTAEEKNRIIGYFVMELAIAALFQLFYSVRSIVVENKSLLVVANFNMFGITMRMWLSAFDGVFSKPENGFIFSGISLSLLLLHAGASYVAQENFGRYHTFSISPDSEILKLYSTYETLRSVSTFDLQLALMVITPYFVIFAHGQGAVHYVCYALFVLFVAATYLGTDLGVKTEKLKYGRLSVVLHVPPLLLAILALACPSECARLDTLSVVWQQCKQFAIFSVVSLSISRICVVVVLQLCMRNFDKGLKEALAGASDRREKRRTQDPNEQQKLFLSPTESYPEQESSITFSPKNLNHGAEDERKGYGTM